MKKLLFCAALMLAAVFSSCSKEYDDTGLKNEIEILKDRIAAVEERLTQEVNTLKGLIQAAEAGLAVGVEEVDGGYEITIGDETFTINHGTDGEDGTDGTNGTDGTVITVVEVDGVYYWAIDGEATEYPVTGNDGEDGEDGAPGQNGYTPEIKDGKWYINGEEVGPATGANGENGDSFFKNVVVNEDDTVTFTLANDTTITVALAKSAKYNDVKSIKFVPEYSDGKMTIGFANGAKGAYVKAKFEVIPAAAAELIAKYPADASMQAVYTKTRAKAGEVVELPISSIEAKDGIITVTASAEGLAEEFFEGKLGVSVRFAIQDDLSGNASEYVEAVADEAFIVTAAIDEGTDNIRELFRQWGTDWYNYGWHGKKSINGLFESVKLTWNDYKDADKFVVAYDDKTVEVTDGSTEVIIEGLKTSPVEFTITAYAGDDEVGTYTVASDVYTLPETASGTFSAVFDVDNQTWTIIGEDFNTTQYATWNCSFNIYEKGSETPVFENPITKNGNNATYTYISYICRGNGYVQTSKDTHVAFHVGDGNWDQGKTFKGLKGNTEYEVRFELNVWPYIYDANGAETDGVKQWDLVKALMTNDKATFHGVHKLAGTTTFTTGDAPEPVALNVKADIDNGTENVRELFRKWGGDWYTYGTWNGKRSVNGQFESVTLSWNEIEEADKVVIEYLDQTIENTSGLTFQVIDGLKTSPVEFTVTAYQGDKVIVSETVSSDVYTLPETASGTFSATYSADNQGWTILGEDFNTTQYATWNCSFNIYEKGSETPVFENPITKNGKNETYAYISYVCRADGWVQASKNTFVGFHVGDGNWDQGTVFTGLKGNTEYEVRFELNVWPYIYDPNGPETDLNKPQWDLVKILMTDDKATFHGVHTLAGTTTFTTGEGPAEFEVIAAINDGTQRIQTQYTDGHRGFKAINGIYEGAKLSWAANDAIAKVVIKYNDGTAEQTKTVTASEWTAADGRVSYTVEGIKAHTATFAVEAFNSSDVSLATTEVETNIYHLATPELVFTPSKQESGEWKLDMSQMSNAYNSFYSVTFNIYKDGVALFDTPLAKNVDGGSTENITAWAGNRGCNSWLSTNDYDGGIKTFAADKFDYATEYEVRYTLTAWPTIFDAAAQATNHHNHAEWFYWSSILMEPQTVAEVSTTFTTEAAPVVEIDWSAVVSDNYTVENWESPYHLTETTLWNGRGLGYYSGLKGVYKANELKDNNGNAMGEPRDGQKYAICYSYWNFICFDIDSTEINPETMQPQEGTGCYALINMIDRPGAVDKILENYSYYNKNEETFYVSFLLRGIFDMNEDGSLKEGKYDHEHTGKLIKSGTK